MKKDNRFQLSPELLERARTGDREALTALYECSHQAVYRTVHAMLRDENLVLDVQQETYLHAFSHLDQLRDAGSFLPWLRQIAVNVARTQLRKRTPILFSELSANDAAAAPDGALNSKDPSGDPVLHLEQKENARLVREILDELSDGQRMLVAMYYYENIPIRQIAESLQISQGTVKTQLHRSRKKVEDRVRALEQEGVKLFGLGPIPFLVALLRNETPAVEAGKSVLPAVGLHVGHTFFETALGRVVLGSLVALTIGGGIYGYSRWQESRDEAAPAVLQVTEATGHAELLFTPPTGPPTRDEVVDPTGPSPPDKSEEATPEDLNPEPTEMEASEPEPTETEASEPEPTVPEASEPRPTETEASEPRPTETAPTVPEPSATQPPPAEPSEPAASESEETEPAPEASAEEVPATAASDVLPTAPPYPPSPGTVTLSLGETWTYQGVGAEPHLEFFAQLASLPVVYDSTLLVGEQIDGAASIRFTPTEPGRYTIYYAIDHHALISWATVVVPEG